MGFSLFLLAAYVAFDAGKALLEREKPDASVVSIVLTAVSIAVMFWLAAAKRRTAALLGSSALRADDTHYRKKSKSCRYSCSTRFSNSDASASLDDGNIARPDF